MVNANTESTDRQSEPGASQPWSRSFRRGRLHAPHDEASSPDDKKNRARSGLLRTLLPWIATTTAAAAIGAMVNSYLEKANPSIAVNDIGISSQFNNRFGKHQLVTVPQEAPIFRHLDQSNWTESIRNTSADLHEVTQTLTDDRDEVEKLLENMNAFHLVISDMKMFLSGPRNKYQAEAFFDKWEPLRYFIWGAI